MDPEIFGNLRKTLANLYPDESSIPRLLADAVIDSSRIFLHSTPTNNWHAILIEAEKIGRVDALLAIVEQEYRNNEVFQRAYIAYQQSTKRHNDPQPKAQPSLFRYFPLLLSLIVGEAILTILFYQYKDQYLIAWESYWLLAGVLIFVIAAWWRALSDLRRSSFTIKIIICSVLTILWLGFLGRQVWAIVNPPKFSQEQFGIAVATFGQGPNFYATSKGYEISGRLYRDLEVALAKDPALAARIGLQRTGVVDSKEAAEKRGIDINAKLVIWGYLVLEGNHIDVYFNVLQASELIDNPAFPQTIPLTPRLLGNKIPLPYDPSVDLETMIAEPSLGIGAFGLGLAYYFDRQYNPAIQEFRRALDYLQPDWTVNCESTTKRNSKDLGLIYFYLGKSYQALGDYINSQNKFDCGIKYNPDDLAILLGQAYNYRALGEKAKQKDTYKRIIALSLTQPEEGKYQAAYDRAIAYEYLQDYENALLEYKDIIDENHKPDFFVAYLGAGSVLTQLKRFGEAVLIYQKANPLASTDPIRQVWLAMGRGQLYEKRGDVQAAIQAYQKAIALDSRHTVVSPYYYLAQLYAKNKDNKDAEQNYIKLIELSQIPSWARGVYANYLYEDGKYMKAIQQFTMALNAAIHEEPVLHAQLGLAYAAVDEHDQPDKEKLSRAQFELALQNPGDAETYIRGEYGRILFQFQHRDEAVEQLQDAIKADRSPTEADKNQEIVTRRNLGLLYELQGERDKAIEMYRSLLKTCEQIPGDTLSFVLDRLESLNVEQTDCAIKG